MFDNVSGEIGLAIVTGVVSIVTMVTKWGLSKMDDYILKKNKFSRREVTIADVEIDRLLDKVMDFMDADRCFIGRFHNGGKFANGNSMEKFSIANEVYRPYEGNVSIMDDYQNVLLSQFTEVMAAVILKGEFVCEDVKALQSGRLKSGVEKNGSKSFVCIRIMDKRSGIEQAFLSINWNRKKVEVTEDILNYLRANSLELQSNLNISFQK